MTFEADLTGVRAFEILLGNCLSLERNLADANEMIHNERKAHGASTEALAQELAAAKRETEYLRAAGSAGNERLMEARNEIATFRAVLTRGVELVQHLSPDGKNEGWLEAARELTEVPA